MRPTSSMSGMRPPIVWGVRGEDAGEGEEEAASSSSVSSFAAFDEPVWFSGGPPRAVLSSCRRCEACGSSREACTTHRERERENSADNKKERTGQLEKRATQQSHLRAHTLEGRPQSLLVECA